MIAERRAFRVGTYNNGQPYSLPRGRYAPRGQVEDRLAPTLVVVDLDCERPVATKFLGQIVRELRIRFYKAKTVKSYRCALAGFLRWFGNRPHLITREDVRCYLELLVDGGAGASWVGIHLSGKMTVGLVPCTDDQAGVPAARVDLTILTDTRPIRLPGIVVCEPRCGWVVLELPPLEAWAEPLRWLTPAERERVESAEFYRLLQQHVTSRFLASGAAQH